MLELQITHENASQTLNWRHSKNAMQSGVLTAVLRSDFTLPYRSPRRWLHTKWEDFKSRHNEEQIWKALKQNYCLRYNCTHADALHVHPFEKHIEPSTYVIIQSQNLGSTMTCPKLKYRDWITSSTSGEGRPYRSDGRFWPVDLCCAVVRRKSASLRLVSMTSDTVLPQQQLKRWGNRIAVISTQCGSLQCRLLASVSLCRRSQVRIVDYLACADSKGHRPRIIGAPILALGNELPGKKKSLLAGWLRSTGTAVDTGQMAGSMVGEEVTISFQYSFLQTRILDMGSDVHSTVSFTFLLP
jgi:hypothetical protein